MQRRRAGRQNLYNSALRDSLNPFLYRTHFLRYTEFTERKERTRFMKKNIFTKDNLMFFIILNLGLIFTAVGIAIFKTPNHFAFGGTSGLSIILSTLFPKWNVGAFMWIVNAALVVLGFFFLGIRSMGWTVYSSFALSFYVSACEAIYPLSSPLTHDVFLELCFAVILPAVGAAMVFNVGASTGGTDIVAMILHKYTSLEIGRALLVSDLGIVLIAAYLYGAQTGLYCILGMTPEMHCSRQCY